MPFLAKRLSWKVNSMSSEKEPPCAEKVATGYVCVIDVVSSVVLLREEVRLVLEIFVIVMPVLLVNVSLPVRVKLLAVVSVVVDDWLVLLPVIDVAVVSVVVRAAVAVIVVIEVIVVNVVVEVSLVLAVMSRSKLLSLNVVVEVSVTVLLGRARLMPTML
jgi:hypothetical protein